MANEKENNGYRPRFADKILREKLETKEIKLGGEKLIEEGVKNLKKLESIIDTTKMPHHHS